MRSTHSRLIAILLTLTASLLMGFSSPSQQPVKATWVWQTELIEDGGEQLLHFATEQRVNLIYVQINRDLPYEAYEPFIKNAHAAGVAVHALGGDPGWALKVHRERLLGLVNWVQNYNNSAASKSKFDGIHLDIEPYVLDQWEEDPNRILSSWIDNMQAYLSAASSSGLELGIDLPFWFDSYKMPDNPDIKLNEWFMKSFDRVTIMAYRNTIDSEHGIVYLAKDELELADRLGKQILIAVNTKEMPGQSHTSFYGKDRQQLSTSLEQLSDLLHSYSSFGGVAIHDFRHWENMPVNSGGEDPGTGTDPEPEPKPDPTPDPNPDPDPQPTPDPGTSVPDPDPVVRSETVRGTYIWEAGEVLQNGQAILDFAKEKNLNWLYIRLDLQQPYEVYRSFMKQASAAGIEVHAMGGHPIWALKENRPKMMKLLNYVKEYNRLAAGDERFHGIHLDIEPYVLPEWRDNNQELIGEWTDNLAAFTNELKKDSNLQSSMDLAVWLDKYTMPDDKAMSVSKWMINQMDHVSLMAFRDTAAGSNGIAKISKEELAFASELGKPILISVEMKESHEGNHITFYEEGSAYMEQELAKLPDLLQEYTTYSGNVVHAYDYWKNAKP
ncbi:hypothetical protein [Paenibacillus pini]|uniref:Glycosyl hydrolase-like 10 domain-containing protein n=1 Tax=Paenibacillus pini JCM 16418 TaxID=1236976 RepID=W7YIK6_9BACL|nr:hypothetical protein [Paenibacillus pini]GAF07453.1 hypothetical protein JCM16418_1469 [Paenibacillus pini JCM 16418]